MKSQDLRILPKLARFHPHPNPLPQGEGGAITEGEGEQISDNRVSPKRVCLQCERTVTKLTVLSLSEFLHYVTAILSAF